MSDSKFGSLSHPYKRSYDVKSSYAGGVTAWLKMKYPHVCAPICHETAARPSGERRLVRFEGAVSCWLVYESVPFLRLMRFCLAQGCLRI